ncbi:hypothetical protein BDC45DRAFT_572199 [Circinella umbellata]|nr:hypothetical protein BDC45DRAFT_572199 [Circinella umbellata]
MLNTNRICMEIDNKKKGKRPDGTITLREHYHGTAALEFCEVKGRDNRDDVNLRFINLLRLGMFAKNAIDKETIKSVMVVQAIDGKVTFYMMEVLASGFYPLTQLCTINILTALDGLQHLLMDLSLLKRIHVAYKEHCSKLDSSQILKVQKFKNALLQMMNYQTC